MEFIDLSAAVVMILFAASFIAGFIDSLAGGGGLISLPALILSGMPPLLALGTNKLQGTVGTAAATLVMLKSKRVRWQDIKNLMLAAFIGAMLGAILIQFVNTEMLSSIIPAVLLFIAIYFLLSPMFQQRSPQQSGSPHRLSQGIYQTVVVPVIGCYDGMFGPGTGSFFALVGVSLRGHGLIDATAVAKTLNFATNFASLIVFAVAGKVVWLIGAVMMLGQFMGAWCGAHYLLRIDSKYIRLIVVIMCFGMLAKYLFSLH